MRSEIPEGLTRLRGRKLQRTLWNYSIQEYHILLVRIGQLEMKRKGEQFILDGILLSHAIKERGCRVPVLSVWIPRMARKV